MLFIFHLVKLDRFSERSLSPIFSFDRIQEAERESEADTERDYK